MLTGMGTVSRLPPGWCAGRCLGSCVCLCVDIAAQLCWVLAVVAMPLKGECRGHDPLGLGYCPGRRRGLRGTLQPFQRFLSGGRIRPSGPCGEYKGAFSRCEYILPYDQHCAVCLCWGCDTPSRNAAILPRITLVTDGLICSPSPDSCALIGPAIILIMAIHSLKESS